MDVSSDRFVISFFRRPLVVVAVAVVVLAAGLSTTASVASTPSAEAVKLSPSPDKNSRAGSPSAKAKAGAKARQTKERVEVESERTATDSVYANPDGTFSREEAQAPIRAKDAAGKLAPIDTDLASKEGRLASKVATGDVSFSADGKGEGARFNLSNDSSVGLSFKGELGAPVLKGAAATYVVETPAPEPAAEQTPSPEQSPEPEPSAGPAPAAAAGGEKVRLTAGADGFNANVILSEAPATAPTYTFTLRLAGLKASLKDNVLELTNPAGKVVAESRPLQMWDSARDSAGDPSNIQAVDAKLVEGTNGDVELTLSPAASFLNDPKTQYPLTIDPDISAVDRRGDTYYFNGQATSDSRGSDYRLRTGYQDGATHRSLLTFGYKQYVGQTVTAATLKLRQYSSATCSNKTTNLFPVTADVSGTITWATRPTIEDSNRFKSSKSFNHGQGSCPDAYEELDVTPMVSAWAGGTLNGDTAGNHRQGIEMRASSENDGSYDKRFCSNDLSNDDNLNCNDTDYIPVLSVTYAAELGDQSWYSMTGHQLNDKSTLSINNATGNAYVEAEDANVNARGLGFDATRSYNSQAPETTSMGKGWNTSIGADVWLEKKSEFRYDYHAPNGTVFGSFVRKTSDTGSSVYDNFITPLGGVDADLDEDTDAFRLTFHDSQLTYEFTEKGSDGHLYLAKAVDRSGNESVTTYTGTTPSGLPKLSSVTDAGGRTYNVTYGTLTSANFITKIAESGGLGREWNYTYTGDYLTKYKDADGKETDYAYATGFDGPDQLETITDPTSSTGQRPTTTLEHGHDGALNVDQVTDVHYVLDGSTVYDYSWNYFDDQDGSDECDDHDHGDFATEVNDPNGGITSFCYKLRDEAGEAMKTWVYDGEGNKRDEDFNVDNQTQTLTSGATGSTVSTYGSSIPDQLKTVTDEKSGSTTTGERTNIDYDHDDGAGDDDPDGGDYLPGSVTDPNGDCIRYEYDAKGHTTASITKLRGSGTDRSCTDASGGVKHVFEYNTDGTVSKSADGNAGSSPTDAEKTIYTYWATSDTGYIAGSKGLIKSVREPSGDCTTGAGRKLCKSYTYDAAGRVKTTTDGAGIVTTSQYDNNDRTTKVLFGGATSCAGGNTNCVDYTWDAEGNLKTRAEAAGTTNFTYDRLNRQLTRAMPNGTSVGMSYDGVGNTTQYTQTIASTTDTPVIYEYDKANSVISVTDAAGKIDITPDDDGHSEKILFPGANRILLDYDYKDSGKAEEATVTNAAGTELREYKYDYTDGSDDEDQLQSRDASGTLIPDGAIDYEYENGTLDKATDHASGGVDYDYSHDNINNVTSEKIGSTTTYFGYDRAGQLCWRGATDGTKLGTTCPTTPTGDTTLSHDAAGNNTNTATTPTTYNNHNQVTKLGTLDMGYLDLGNDLRTDAGTAQFVEGPLGVTARKDGAAITFYTRAPDGTILDARVAGTTVSKYNYFTEPHNNSVAAIYAPDGSEVGSYEYSPYGDTTATGTDAADNPFRYISSYQDTAGTEDYYKLGARYYDTRGHFTQPDPVPGGISDPRTMTGYNYAAGDPINRFDPTGLCWGPDRICDAGRGIARAAKATYTYLTTSCAASLVLAGTSVTGLGVAFGAVRAARGARAGRHAMAAGSMSGSIAEAGIAAIGAYTGVGAVIENCF